MAEGEGSSSRCPPLHTPRSTRGRSLLGSRGGRWAIRMSSRCRRRRRRRRTVAHEIIDLDANDDPDGVMIICEKASSHKSNHSVSHPSDWPKHPKSGLAEDVPGPSHQPGTSTVLPWGCTTPGRPRKHKEIKIVDNKIDEKYKAFKQFDTVTDHSDHYYSMSGKGNVPEVKKPSKDWVRRIQHEWKVLEKDLPGTIFVRVYEDRMELLRAVIVGPAGTPYHDGLFFFDVYFPSQYPKKPPLVNYRSGGLRLNPNLYDSGKVCLSLLNTWSGHGCEKWNPSNSTMLQVLVSIQALVLNAKPYFNEPGYAASANTPQGEKMSMAYNESTFLLSCRTMLYSLRNPPKHFEDFARVHFCKYGRNILVGCKAYMNGAQVGCLAGNGVQDVDEGDKSCSANFKGSLKTLFDELIKEFTRIGVHCHEFQPQRVNPGSTRAKADTTLRL
uniref:E2 ubiquitin-conjugating enzyme n=1 Tax=Oryza nivara TaxID=4536 RepID=A0A0E0IHK3_ORYNI